MHLLADLDNQAIKRWSWTLHACTDPKPLQYRTTVYTSR